MGVVVPLPPDRLRRPPGRGFIIRRLLRFLAAIAALCAVAAFPASEVFAVRSTSVAGNAAVPAADILLRAQVSPGTSAFRVNAEEVRDRLLQDPRIEDATVTMVFPRQVTILVRERQPVAALLVADGYLTVGDDGAAMAQVLDPGPLPALIVARLPWEKAQIGTVLASPDVRLGAWTAGALPARLRDQVTALEVDDQGDVSLILRDGVSVQIGDAPGLADRLAMLPDVLDAIAARQMRVESVDLRFRGNIIVQPAGGASSSDAADPGERQENPSGRGIDPAMRRPSIH
jgi:cell division protein FtsQ